MNPPLMGEGPPRRPRFAEKALKRLTNTLMWGLAGMQSAGVPHALNELERAALQAARARATQQRY
ncbi:MAG: hypothetical protein RIT81_08800 [Deltaproteobacteria bacterium]